MTEQQLKDWARGQPMSGDTVRESARVMVGHLFMAAACGLECVLHVIVPPIVWWTQRKVTRGKK